MYILGVHNTVSNLYTELLVYKVDGHNMMDCVREAAEFFFSGPATQRGVLRAWPLRKKNGLWIFSGNKSSTS